MKKIIYISIFVFCCFNNKINAQIPELNEEIVDFVTSVIGTKVDRGECWDLAAKALNKFDAKWNGQYIYGERVNYKKDTIFPGDLIQFKNVKLQYRKGNQIFKESMKKHTAIVYEVLGDGVFRIAHQNTSVGGKKVIVNTLDVSDLKKGKLCFYRPVKK